MAAMSPTSPPDALLFVAPGCPHCGAVLEGLGALVKEGAVGRLEVVNVAVQPDRAAELGVKTVPWTRIGPFELEGALPPGELRRWAQSSDSIDGMAAYFLLLLKNGRRGKVEEMARREPQRLLALVRLLEDTETTMAVRLGIGAVLEELQGAGLTEVMIPGLGALTWHEDPHTRADACHFLSLIGGAAVVPYLQARLDDEDREVREIAAEVLEELGAGS
jgi:hypothetical protein